MYIEEVILDGFKSYATRTVISGWDPEFNAITGLNGSGKSNILDSICFVLGISTLSQVRATNLADLVYKRGQAGVNKATVTIVFNNEDEEKSPPGWKNHKQLTVTRQIVVGGRNKYLINGAVKTQQDVTKLFHSVQLNVNNPHFLIMQGRVTKVLNMKPEEILAMIEEAAGTRMYEDRKEVALKTMAKKDTKVAEITDILENEITPKLAELREKKRHFLEYQKMDTELSTTSRFILAYDVFKLKGRAETYEVHVQEVRDRMKASERQSKVLTLEIERMEKHIEALKADRAKNNTGFERLEKDVKESSRELGKVQAQYDLAVSSVKEEEARRDNAISGRLECQKNSGGCQSVYDRLVTEFSQRNEEYLAKVKRLQYLEDLFQTLSTGMSASKGQENGYMDQLKATKRDIAAASSAGEQAKLKVSHARKDLEALTAQERKARKLNEPLMAKLQKKKEAIELLKAKIVDINGYLVKEQSCLTEKNAILARISETQHLIQMIERDIGSHFFSYEDPERNFDRSRVKGLVAELISILKSFGDTSTALETCAGGRLYNVVVESEMTATLLLENGKLRKRVTFIPLNKISYHPLDEKRIASAKSLGKDNANLALDLIEYSPDVTPAMTFVFGHTFICNDQSTAKLLTFDKSVRTRCVTLDGDIYDPAGSLSGGAKTSSQSFLLRLEEYRHHTNLINDLEAELAKVHGRLKECQKVIADVKTAKEQTELQEHECKLFEEQVASNENSMCILKVEKLRAEIEALQVVIKENADLEKSLTAKCESISKEMKEFAYDKDGKLKSIENEIATLKAQIASDKPLITKSEREVELAKEEIRQNEEEIANLRKQEVELNESIGRLHANIVTVKTALTESKQVKMKKQQAAEAIADASKSKAQIEKMVAESQSSQERLGDILKDKDNVWIHDQMHLFGAANGPYDFSKVDINDHRKLCAQLSEKHKRLGRTLDRNVLEVFDKVEKKEVSLVQMLATVKKDKKKIEDTIASLDQHKKDALERTWTRVSRSLVALSLILSLLQFKPAPMYILDEVDSALDESHTQNIGQLLRNRFKGSQFILVSLKDGMYSNANVLFRAKFRDGVSVVERFSQKGKKGR
ncbi:Structural maintenance of chromosomes protein 2 [Irineochytrium annulatum]|nr:Structural maintenance of chromosomes protein 2 [Irineochytrium annulatum]